MNSHPLEIRLTKKMTFLEVDWDDGITTGIEAATLRRYCKCSECISQNGRGHPHAIIYEGISIATIVSLGSNAVNLKFSDGHAEGIYPFPYLREIAQKSIGII